MDGRQSPAFRRVKSAAEVVPLSSGIQSDMETDEAHADSDTTSITSDVKKGIQENNRTYPSYGKYSYGMPIDKEEQERMDLQHSIYAMVVGELYLAPIEDPLRILDLGTGTGIWCVEMADKFPLAHIVGVDIAPIQPKFAPTNCHFQIDDIEEPWTWRERDRFDYVHIRNPLHMIRNWSKLIKQAYDHLHPGGYFELASIYPRPKCDDGTMPTDSKFL